jgi:hypothetical protein
VLLHTRQQITEHRRFTPWQQAHFQALDWIRLYLAMTTVSPTRQPYLNFGEVALCQAIAMYMVDMNLARWFM